MKFYILGLVMVLACSAAADSTGKSKVAQRKIASSQLQSDTMQAIYNLSKSLQGLSILPSHQSLMNFTVSILSHNGSGYNATVSSGNKRIDCGSDFSSGANNAPPDFAGALCPTKQATADQIQAFQLIYNLQQKLIAEGSLSSDVSTWNFSVSISANGGEGYSASVTVNKISCSTSFSKASGYADPDFSPAAMTCQ